MTDGINGFGSGSSSVSGSSSSTEANQREIEHQEDKLDKLNADDGKPATSKLLDPLGLLPPKDNSGSIAKTERKIERLEKQNDEASQQQQLGSVEQGNWRDSNFC